MRRIMTISFVALIFTSMLSGQEKNQPLTAEKNKSKPVAATVLPLKPSAESAAVRLPVRRVVLYKNGVGYFEHTGRVNGSQQVGIDFTTAQLNDALKSLTVVDLGGGRITGVNYNSVAPLEQRLKTLRLPLTASTSREEYLNALRGARVEVKNGAASAMGRVLSIDVRERTRDDKSTEQRYELSLITDVGELRTFELTPATSVRLAEHDLNGEISRYMDLIASTRAEDLRRMTVSTSGNGERALFVSYISEVPVWKSTYRIILPEKATDKPRLQGWAIVDNTVGEDWTNVELSLVAGAPQSFVENLSQPLYIRRPIVELPKTAQLTPQTHEGTLDGMEVIAAIQSPQPVGGISGGSANGVLGGTLAFESAAGNAPASPASITRMKSDQAKKLKTELSNENKGWLGNDTRWIISDAERAAFTNSATSQELGDLFEYKLKDRVTIAKNQSALVPILSALVEAEKVTLWHEGAPYPLRALWLTNSSGETLDAGTFNIVDAGAFAGEGVVEHIKPNEKRLLSYAVDQGIRIDTKQDSKLEHVTRIKVFHGVMTRTRQIRENKIYTIRNEDVNGRTLVIEHPLRAEWKLADSLKPAETSANTYRFKIQAASKQTQKLEVEEYKQLENSVYINNLDNDVISTYLNEKSIPVSLEKTLRDIVMQKGVINGIGLKTQSKNREIETINNDQSRVRENMKALKGSAEEKALIERYTRQLNTQEDQLESLRKEVVALNQQYQQEQAKLDKMIMDLNLEENM